MKPIFNENTEKWDNLHLQLQDMLAAYVDNELDEDDISLLEAHLLSCKLCQHDVARQTTLSQKMTSIPVAKLSAEQHQQFNQALLDPPPISSFSSFKRTIRTFIANTPKPDFKTSWLGGTGWAVSLLLMIIMWYPFNGTVKKESIPMLEDVITQYNTVQKEALPASESAVMPVNWNNARLLSSWKTTIAGKPAQAFVVRSNDHIIVQFKIDEGVFFRSAKVRQAILKSGHYKQSNQELDILALPLKKGGLLMVGDKGALPKIEKLIEAI